MFVVVPSLTAWGAFVISELGRFSIFLTEKARFVLIFMLVASNLVALNAYAVVKDWDNQIGIAIIGLMCTSMVSHALEALPGFTKDSRWKRAREINKNSRIILLGLMFSKIIFVHQVRGPLFNGTADFVLWICIQLIGWCSRKIRFDDRPDLYAYYAFLHSCWHFLAFSQLHQMLALVAVLKRG